MALSPNGNVVIGQRGPSGVEQRDVSRVGQRGASRIGCLLGLVLVAFGGYVAVQFAGGEIDARQIRGEAEHQADLAATRDDATIREAISREASTLGLPASAGTPTIQRFPGDRIQIIIEYSDPLDFFGRWQWVRNRRIQVDQRY